MFQRATARFTRSLYDVEFHGDGGLYGWAVGTGGAAAVTRDAGTTWAFADVPTTDDFYSVCVVDAARVWAAGVGRTVWHSGDAGATFTARVAPPLAASANDGFATLESASSVWDCAFSEDGEYGYFVGRGRMVVGVSRGASSSPRLRLQFVKGKGYWNEYLVKPWDVVLYGVATSADGRQAWAVGSHDSILVTGDYGRRWYPRRPPVRPPPVFDYAQNEYFTYSHFLLSAVQFAHRATAGAAYATGTSASIGWAVGSHHYFSTVRQVAVGVVLYTSDGGVTWARRTRT